MKVACCEQGSREWIEARLGIPTASNFDRILTAKTLKPSSQAQAYAEALAAEWVIGEPAEDIASGFIERGLDLEDDARRAYSFERGVTVERVGLCLLDDGSAGCSPDGLVGTGGGLELKCPSAKQHVGYLLDPQRLADDYRLQVHGSLYVTGRAWWDVMSYSPVMPPVIVRVSPDEEVSSRLAEALASFAAVLAAKKERLRVLGCIPSKERKRAAAKEVEARAASFDADMWGGAEPVRDSADPVDFDGPFPF